MFKEPSMAERRRCRGCAQCGQRAALSKPCGQGRQCLHCTHCPRSQYFSSSCRGHVHSDFPKSKCVPVTALAFPSHHPLFRSPETLPPSVSAAIEVGLSPESIPLEGSEHAARSISPHGFVARRYLRSSDRWPSMGHRGQLG